MRVKHNIKILMLLCNISPSNRWFMTNELVSSNYSSYVHTHFYKCAKIISIQILSFSLYPGNVFL